MAAPSLSWQSNTGTFLTNGEAMRLPLADESVHAVVTSPPYWSLRDYGLPPTLWPAVEYQPMAGIPAITVPAMSCCLGLEPDPTAFVAHLVLVFREVRRVLRGDGTAWVNMGDSYASGEIGRHDSVQRREIDGRKVTTKATKRQLARPVTRLPAKNLLGIPWRVAMALQADGWWLRSAPPWVKMNGLPGPWRDRPVDGVENWFLLAKSRRYFYDAEAVRSQSTGQAGQAANFARVTKENVAPGQETVQHRINREATGDNGTRNRRTSDPWLESLDAMIVQQRATLRHLVSIRKNGGMLVGDDGEPLGLYFSTQGYKGAHFACFPPRLIEPLIRCSTSERGVCPRCGAPWVRVTNTKRTERNTGGHSPKRAGQNAGGVASSGLVNNTLPTTTTTGWRPSCDCIKSRCPTGEIGAPQLAKLVATTIRELAPVPAIVLDPFAGSGTTLETARRLGRRGVGVDLSFGYLANEARQRLKLDALDAWETGAGEAETAGLEGLPLFEGAS